MSDMNAIDIARRLAELGEKEKACQGYTLVIGEERGKGDPDRELEGALYLLQNGGNYRVAYDSFRSLYNRGCQRELCKTILDLAFYHPNLKPQKKRYEKNRRLLARYPYLFRKDFPDFEELPLRFYPYDDEHYAPFFVEEERFGENINFNHPVVSRSFFHDLEKPVLAGDVYSMYELRYLKDNVRKSEWVGRENHLYLHYTDWGTFCSHLQVLNLADLLEEKKIVFLIGEEVEQYPIDFKARYGVDYSQYTPKDLDVREVTRLIWHTQLATHNGGDFFNEIFDGHPNLIAVTSIMMESIEKAVAVIQESLRTGERVTLETPTPVPPGKLDRMFASLRAMKSPTPKDIFVALFWLMADTTALDPASRIVPAVFFQPHFPNIVYNITVKERGQAVLSSEENEAVLRSPLFQAFPYIKTFTPLRRPTTSTGASNRYMHAVSGGAGDGVLLRLLNRSYMVDWQDRLYQDSVLVRFEDGKLNPRAAFTALAAFLDLPYTESMTYCSLNGKRYPESPEGNDLGFSTAAIYRTYDEYMGCAERYFLEYFLRDVYEYYGYDFQTYDGAPMDAQRVKELSDQMEQQDRYIRELFKRKAVEKNPELSEEEARAEAEERLAAGRANRVKVATAQLRGLRYVNKNGQPLNMMPRLKLDESLLEQPLYR